MIRILLLTALIATAQTTIKPDQLRAAAPEAAKPIILAFSAKGFTPVVLGPGITATQTSTGWVIDVAPAPAPSLKLARTRAQVTAAADGSYPLTSLGVLYRNGLAMTPGVDYNWASGRATPKTPWAADDLVTTEELELQ